MIVHAAFIYDCAIGVGFFFYTEFGFIFLFFHHQHDRIPILKKMLYLKVFIQSLALVLVTNYKLIVCIAKKNK